MPCGECRGWSIQPSTSCTTYRVSVSDARLVGMRVPTASTGSSNADQRRGDSHHIAPLSQVPTSMRPKFLARKAGRGDGGPVRKLSWWRNRTVLTALHDCRRRTVGSDRGRLATGWALHAWYFQDTKRWELAPGQARKREHTAELTKCSSQLSICRETPYTDQRRKQVEYRWIRHFSLQGH